MHSVRDFCDLAFGELGIQLEWKGEGVDEKGCRTDNGECVIEVDPRYFRPAEVELLIGDPSKAKKDLGWEPTHDLKSLVADMVKSDLALFKRDQYLMEGGHNVLRYFE